MEHSNEVISQGGAPHGWVHGHSRNRGIIALCVTTLDGRFQFLSDLLTSE